MIFLPVLLCCFLCVCVAVQELKCNGSWEGPNTRFTIEGHPGVLHHLHPHFSWINGSGDLIATPLGTDRQVLNATMVHLVVSGCVANLTYTFWRHILDPQSNKTTLDDYFANCSINCDEKPQNQTQDAGREAPQPQDGWKKYGVPILVAVLLVAVAAVAVAVAVIFRDQIRRWFRSCLDRVSGRTTNYTANGTPNRNAYHAPNEIVLQAANGTANGTGIGNANGVANGVAKGGSMA